MATKESTQEVEELKELGNAALKAQCYDEAVLHYSYAIKMDPKNCVLYSNRSLAFLKMQRYYYAIQDANETIKLNPKWPKGYFRKGEVEFATYHFLDAYKSYEKALELQPGDKIITQAMVKANLERMKDMRADDQIPWLGAGIGIVLGAIIVIADFLYATKPTHPLLMTMSTILIAIFGYVIARIFRYYVKCQRDGLLAKRDGEESAPTDEQSTETKGDSEKNGPSSAGSTTRYTKSQARQRYKLGKL